MLFFFEGVFLTFWAVWSVFLNLISRSESRFKNDCLSHVKQLAEHSRQSRVIRLTTNLLHFKRPAKLVCDINILLRDTYAITFLLVNP